jgi:hypothetical protein
VYQAPPPPPAVVTPPPGPSAAEIAAAKARQRAARLAARRLAARQAAARRLTARVAAQKRAAQKLAAQKLAAAKAAAKAGSRTVPGARPKPAAVAIAVDDSSTPTGVVVVLGTLGAIALLLLALSLVPAHLAPGYRSERLLVERREQFVLSGMTCMAAAGVVSVLVLLGL